MAIPEGFHVSPTSISLSIVSSLWFYLTSHFSATTSVALQRTIADSHLHINTIIERCALLRITVICAVCGLEAIYTGDINNLSTSIHAGDINRLCKLVNKGNALFSCPNLTDALTKEVNRLYPR